MDLREKEDRKVRLVSKEDLVCLEDRDWKEPREKKARKETVEDLVCPD